MLLCTSVLFCTATLFLYKHVGDFLLDSNQAMKVLSEQGYRRETFVGLSLYFIAINPILEELFWRGVVLNALTNMKLPFAAFPLLWSSFSSAVFHYSILRMILHPPGAEIGVIGLTIYGAFLAVVYKRSKSILVAIVAHASLTDLSVILLICALFQRFSLCAY